MAVRVGELTTEVTPEPEAPVASEGVEQGDEREQVRKALERLKALELRTRSEGFDD
jgi:hypothetical protein